MKTKHWILQSRTALLSLIFYLIGVALYIAGDLIYGLKIGDVTLYVSIAFIGVVCLATFFIIFMLLKSEKKGFLYTLFSLPYLAFSVFRVLDFFDDTQEYLIELILLLAGCLFIILSLITISRYFRKKPKILLEVKKEEASEDQEE